MQLRAQNLSSQGGYRSNTSKGSPQIVAPLRCLSLLGAAGLPSPVQPLHDGARAPQLVLGAGLGLELAGVGQMCHNVDEVGSPLMQRVHSHSTSFELAIRLPRQHLLLAPHLSDVPRPTRPVLGKSVTSPFNRAVQSGPDVDHHQAARQGPLS